MLLDNVQRRRGKAENLVVSEIFVTRLGCEAVKREHHNELGRGFGNDTTTITRVGGSRTYCTYSAPIFAGRPNIEKIS